MSVVQRLRRSWMAKKNARKPSGGAAIKVIENDADAGPDGLAHEKNGISVMPDAITGKANRSLKPKSEQQQRPENFGVSDIKKAAAFVNSIGGLEKAIAVLQILKVAREVQ